MKPIFFRPNREPVYLNNLYKGQVRSLRQSARIFGVPRAWRNYCQGCQHFDNCCRCRLGPTGPDGRKIKLALLWAQGAPCPLGRWPQRDLPSNPPSDST